MCKFFSNNFRQSKSVENVNEDKKPIEKKVKPEEKFEDVDDIFEDVGSYDGPQISDDNDDNDSDDISEDSDHNPATVSNSIKDAESKDNVDQDDEKGLDLEVTNRKSPFLSRSPSPEITKDGKLVGLSTSSIPSVKDILKFDEDEENTAKRKEKKLFWMAKQVCLNNKVQILSNS